MKKKLSNYALMAMIASVGLCGVSLQAFDDTKSLVALEGGYSSLDMDTPTATSVTDEFGHVGLKIGAQTRDYRLFLSFRYFDVEDFDYATQVGAEVQYLINFSSWMNMFIGLNGGYMNIKFAPNGDTTRTLSDSYYGADVGFNFHLSDNVDLELGARVSSLQAENTIASKTYTMNDMVSAYTSVIYKFNLP